MRRLLNFLTVLSLLLCAASVAMGAVASATDRAFRCGRVWGCVRYDASGVAVAFARAPRPAPAGEQPIVWDWPATAQPTGPAAKLGFAWGDVNAARRVPGLSELPFLGRMFQAPVPGRYARVPWWAPAALSAALPVCRAVSIFRAPPAAPRRHVRSVRLRPARHAGALPRVRRGRRG